MNWGQPNNDEALRGISDDIPIGAQFEPWNGAQQQYAHRYPTSANPVGPSVYGDNMRCLSTHARGEQAYAYESGSNRPDTTASEVGRHQRQDQLICDQWGQMLKPQRPSPYQFGPSVHMKADSDHFPFDDNESAYCNEDLIDLEGQHHALVPGTSNRNVNQSQNMIWAAQDTETRVNNSSSIGSWTDTAAPYRSAQDMPGILLTTRPTPWSPMHMHGDGTIDFGSRGSMSNASNTSDEAFFRSPSIVTRSSTSESSFNNQTLPNSVDTLRPGNNLTSLSRAEPSLPGQSAHGLRHEQERWELTETAIPIVVQSSTPVQTTLEIVRSLPE